MEELRRVAFECAARAFGFCMLGVGVTVIGFSFDLPLALKAGTIMLAIVAAGFLLMGRMAESRNHKRFELWHYVPKERRPPEPHARWASVTAMREAYYTFAQHAAVGAIAMFGVAVVVSIAKKVPIL